MAKKKDTEQLKERAEEVREEARELAESSSEAFDRFASTTGSAAKDFANTAYEAAKDLLDTVENAGERFNTQTKPARKRGRKFFKAVVALGAGAALFANENVRNFVSQQVRQLRGEPMDTWGEPPAPTAGDGEVPESSSSTTP